VPVARLTLDEVKAAIAFDQPGLVATTDGASITVTGTFHVAESLDAISPEGPLAAFDLRIELSFKFPHDEPKVFETGGRIPRTPERHINGGGDCCVTVWEDWLARTNDATFAAYLTGPLREYFLGQHVFELTGEWPFDERPHGENGLYEAYAEVLGIRNRKKEVLYHLRLLSKDWPRGHWPCPCGSGKKLRHCHREEMMALHGKLPPPLARRMLRRLKSYQRP